jgi:hypothetical protein
MSIYRLFGTHDVNTITEPQMNIYKSHFRGLCPCCSSNPQFNVCGNCDTTPETCSDKFNEFRCKYIDESYDPAWFIGAPQDPESTEYLREAWTFYIRLAKYNHQSISIQFRSSDEIGKVLLVMDNGKIRDYAGLRSYNHMDQWKDYMMNDMGYANMSAHYRRLIHIKLQ